MLRIKPTVLLVYLGLMMALLATLTAAQEGSAPVVAADPAAESPQEVVEDLHTGLLGIMEQADELGFEGRFQQLRPVVARTFDVEFMGSKSVGSHWKKLTPEEQALWLDKFIAYVTANYVGNFNTHNGEQFETLGDEAAQRETRVVLTQLKVPNDEAVSFNYRLRRTPQGWRIIDIYLKGTVSELALRRSDFTATLKNRGFADLAATVDQKIADLQNQAGG